MAPTSHSASAPPTVFIVGATSAVASEVARRYATRGARLALLGRDRVKLRDLVESLPNHLVLWHKAADFTDFDANPGLVASALEALGGHVDVVLIAHGYLGEQLETEANFAEARKTIDVNFTSVVSLLIPLANHLEGQGSGSICVISSVAGERGRPRNYTYGAAKGALTTYLQGVRSRLWPAVRVQTIKLGPVDTPMTATHTKNPSFISCEMAAKGIEMSIDRGELEAYVPRFWRPVMAVVRALPEGLFQRLGFLSGR